MTNEKQLALLINVQHGRIAKGFNANMLAPSLEALKEKHKNIKAFENAKYVILQNDYDVSNHVGYKQSWDDKIVRQEMKVRKELEKKIINISNELIKGKLDRFSNKGKSLWIDLKIAVNDYKTFSNLMVMEDKNTPLLNSYPENELTKGSNILTIDSEGNFEQQRLKFIDIYKTGSIVYVELSSKKERINDANKLLVLQKEQYKNFKKLEPYIGDPEEKELHIEAKHKIAEEIKELKNYKNNLVNPNLHGLIKNSKDLEVKVKLKITDSNSVSDWIKDLDDGERNIVLSKLKKYESYQQVNCIYIKKMIDYHEKTKDKKKEYAQELVR